MDLTFAEWKKSSYSNPSSNNCVEVAVVPRLSAVRDSQYRELGRLEFPVMEWAAFLSAAKRDAL